MKTNERSEQHALAIYCVGVFLGQQIESYLADSNETSLGHSRLKALWQILMKIGDTHVTP
jgi:hypothetical protein